MNITSRQFLVIAVVASCYVVAHLAADALADQPGKSRPNILWLTAEDLSPHLGCDGDGYARTPNLDALARQGVRYTRAFATAPVCSPTRSCLITGMYATSLGTQRLRSQFPVPDTVRAFSALLREAGYYCSNNVKTDYNLTHESALSVLDVSGAPQEQTQVDHPNILWITSEDNSPYLGCYGDLLALKPNLDRLAAQGVRYRHALANAPVCSTARTTLITGMHACALGAQHHRSRVPIPDAFRLYPQYLREVGYYCTNNSKTDYNLAGAGEAWDESSPRAHYKNRPNGQPFFAIIASCSAVS